MAKYQTVELRDFTKGLRIGYPDRSYQLNETPDCWNIDFYPEGAITKRTGWEPKHATSMDGSGSPVIMLDQFFANNGSDFLFGFTAVSASCGSGSVYVWKSSTDSWTHMGSAVIGSGWTPQYTDPILSETFADRFIVTNCTSNNPIYWTTSVVSSFQPLLVSGVAGYVYHDTFDSGGNAISACVACKALKSFKNYLFIANTTEGGTSYPGRLRWSGIEDPHAWPTANYMDLDPNDGDFIVGMDILGDYLVVFKERKIYAISYIGGMYLFTSELRVDGRGCVSPQSLTSIRNDLIFLAEDGFYQFTGHDIKEISYGIKPYILDINPSNKSIVQSAPLEEKNQLWFIAPSGDSDTCNVAFVYDYNQENWTINSLDLSALGFYYVTDDLTMADLTNAWNTYTISWDDKFTLANTSVLIVGTYDGIVGDMGFATNDGGLAIDGKYRTPWIDMENPLTTKRILRITFLQECEGTSTAYNLDWKLRTNWNKDMDPVLSGTIPVSGNTGGIMIESRIDLSLQARSFQLEFGTDGADEPWKVYNIYIDYMTKGTPAVDDSGTI